MSWGDEMVAVCVSGTCIIVIEGERGSLENESRDVKWSEGN